MYMQAQDSFNINQDQEFSRPVESIMRCEDFKSNFARRLSNRYITRSPNTSSRQDSGLKLRAAESTNSEVDPENVRERVELSSQLSKNGDKEQNCETSKLEAVTATQTGIRHIEASQPNGTTTNLGAMRHIEASQPNGTTTNLGAMRHIEASQPDRTTASKAAMRHIEASQPDRTTASKAAMRHIEASQPDRTTASKAAMRHIEPSQMDGTTASQAAMRHTEVTALHLEVDTLRWQLAQTEANRQMHIGLLNQIVTFLNRVKDHIECQKTELNDSNGNVKDISTRRVPRSFNTADIPRSRSVVHVNKHLEYSLRPAKKLGTRKISKSISNVNGFKDCNSTWNQSKISLTPDTDQSQKIVEEITRLTILANTVLSTKLPDLACNDVQNNSNDKISVSGDKNELQNSSSCTMDLIDEDAKDAMTSSFVLKSICNNSNLYEDLPSSLVDAVDDNMNEFTMPLSPLSCGIAKEFAELKLSKEQQSHIFEDKSKITNAKSSLSNKKLDYNHATSKFIEDESGFSSMSSFQEIGIPIISIIPPSPCREVGYVDNIPEIIEETGKWKSELELSKQTVKVFWV